MFAHINSLQFKLKIEIPGISITVTASGWAVKTPSVDSREWEWAQNIIRILPTVTNFSCMIYEANKRPIIFVCVCVFGCGPKHIQLMCTAMKFQLNIIFNCPSTPIDSLLWFTVSCSIRWLKTISKFYMLIEQNISYDGYWMHNWRRAMILKYGYTHTSDKIIIIEFNWNKIQKNISTVNMLLWLTRFTLWRFIFKYLFMEWTSQIDIAC